MRNYTKAFVRSPEPKLPLVPYAKEVRLSVSTPHPDNEHVVVFLDGMLQSLVQEAEAGEHGFVKRVIRDADGRVAISDDAIGSFETETVRGKVEFFLGRHYASASES